MKDDDRAVIERRGVVGERVDRGVEGSADRSAGLDEKINAKMNGATLRKRIGTIAKEL